MAARTDDTRTTTKTNPTTLLRESRFFPVRNTSPGGRSRPGLTTNRPGPSSRSQGYPYHEAAAPLAGRGSLLALSGREPAAAAPVGDAALYGGRAIGPPRRPLHRECCQRSVFVGVKGRRTTVDAVLGTSTTPSTASFRPGRPTSRSAQARRCRSGRTCRRAGGCLSIPTTFDGACTVLDSDAGRTRGEGGRWSATMVYALEIPSRRIPSVLAALR